MKLTKGLTCFIVLLAFTSLLYAADDKGWFGLGLKVDADGIFHPTVRSISVEKIVDNSPAAKAGLSAGDLVLEVQGVKVAGASPNELNPALHTGVGRTLRLKVKHGSGPPREVVLTAAPKP